MKPVMYIIMASPGSVPMSPGKLAAQAAHASVEAYLISDQNKQYVNRWRCGGHYTKIVLMTDDLAVADRYIRDRGFKTAAIIDEGRTEFGGDLTPTALGVEILDKDELHVSETFSAFKLYKSTSPAVVIETGRISPKALDKVRSLVAEGRVQDAQEFAQLHREWRRRNLLSLDSIKLPVTLRYYR